MIPQPTNSGAQLEVDCPCGWKGVRARSSTQPCPGCSQPLNLLPALQRKREYQRNTDALRETKRKAELERVRAHNERERAKEAAELARIDEQLRAAREAARG